MTEYEMQTAPTELTHFESHNAEAINLPQHEQFSAYLDNIESLGIITDPERKAKIQDAGQELIDDFGLTEKFFEDDSKSIIFAAIANDYADLKDTGLDNVGAVTAHKEFLADTLVLLAGNDSAYASLYSNERIGEDDVSAEKMLSVYDKYTNKEVSSDMTAAIEGGLLDDVKNHLGIRTDNEDPYEIRVLNLLSSSANEAYGMLPSTPNDLYNQPYDSPAIKEFEADVEAYNNYLKGLIDNGKDFKTSMDMGSATFPPAWIVTLEGKTLLCVPLTTAEKILYKDEVRSTYYDEGAAERDLATLRHEYVHTQKSVSANGDPFLGIGLEELRAEHFSYDKQGYIDVKRHFKYVSKLTGFNPKDAFDDRVVGEDFDPALFYTKIAQNVGLGGLLDAVLMTPDNYIADEGVNKLQKSISDYVGGTDGLQEKAWDRAVKTVGIERVESSIREMNNSLAEKIDPDVFYRHGGLSFIARKAMELWDKEKQAS